MWDRQDLTARRKRNRMIATPLLTELAHLGSTVAGCRPVRAATSTKRSRRARRRRRRQDEARSAPDLFSAEAHGPSSSAPPRGSARPPRAPRCSRRAAFPRSRRSSWRAARRPRRRTRPRLALHRAEHAFGLDRPGYIGALPQDDTPEPDWATFYARRHSPAQLELRPEALPKERGAGSNASSSACPAPGRPSPRSSTAICGHERRARPGARLFRSAPYGEHREIDLAMLRLFGRPRRATSALRRDYPRAPGHEERRAPHPTRPRPRTRSARATSPRCSKPSRATTEGIGAVAVRAPVPGRRRARQHPERADATAPGRRATRGRSCPDRASASS